LLKSKILQNIVATLLVVIVWLWVGVETSFIPRYADICEYNAYINQGHCTTHHIAFVILWHIGKFFQDFAGVIAAIATIVIAYFTRTLWVATDGMLRASGEQSEAMASSIKEAARSATAMEKVAESIAISAKAATESVATTKEIGKRQELALEMQMRAYLKVVIGSAIYQEREKGKEPLRFEANPSVVNTGNTPAHDVKFRIQAMILPVPLPADHVFPIPQEVHDGAFIGIHQDSNMSATVEDFVDDKEVKDIKRLNGKGLYVWGIVYYKDVFGKDRETEFGQIIHWVGAKVFGLYIQGRNKAT